MNDSFEIFINSRDTFVNIPVDEDQTALVPDPSKILKNSLGCYDLSKFKVFDSFGGGS